MGVTVKVGTVVAVIAFLASVWAVEARAQQPAFDRNEATRIIGNTRKILSPNGIERLEKVRIGGIEQSVSVRGRDRRNRFCCSSMVARAMCRFR